MPGRRQYVICPFNRRDAVVANQLRKYTLKTNCVTVLNQPGSMSTVEDDATLIICGHGVDGGGEISNGLQGPESRTHDPTLLAFSLEVDWRLPTSHFKIKLLGCSCSGFARSLALQLTSYNNVAVGGFVDDMNYDNFNPATGRGSPMSSVPIEGRTRLFTKEQILGADLERIKWFNNRGDQIQKPFFPKTIAI